MSRIDVNLPLQIAALDTSFGRIASVGRTAGMGGIADRGTKSDLWDAPAGVTVLKYVSLGSRECVHRGAIPVGEGAYYASKS